MQTQTVKQLMIGGAALRALGHDRHTDDVDYLVNDTSTKLAFTHDKAGNIDYCNAAGNKFFAAIWKLETKNNGPLASPKALLELKAYAFVQHCQNMNWKKVDSTEYDIQFLVRTYGLTSVTIANKFMTEGELSEVMKVINSVRK